VGVDPRTNRKGHHVAYFVLLEILIEMTVDSSTVEVVRRDRIGRRKEQILTSSGRLALCGCLLLGSEPEVRPPEARELQFSKHIKC
jgi:hypothetical protein